MTVFVGGIHAVGKTFVLKPICEGLGVRHATASQLIKEQRGLENWTVSRQVDAIDQNQKALVAAVQRLEKDGERIVLDGHFVLRRSVNVHEIIGIETFSQLMVHGVILLEASVPTIADRLRQRGDVTWSQTEISTFSQKESQHAEFVCKELQIPFVKLKAFSEDDVRKAVVELLRWPSR